MKILSMPENERPQEKLLFSGVKSLSMAELLALVIRTGSKERSALQLAQDILEQAYEYGGLAAADARELLEIAGVGQSKACAIAAGVELGRRLYSGPVDSRVIVRDSKDAAQTLMGDFDNEKREHLVELILNVKGEVEAKYTVSIGELSATSVHPREVFNPAIRKGAAGIIIAHNHPSGDPTPSREDIDATKRLVEAADIIGIKLVDHLIIGENSYVSLRAEGLIRD